MTVEHLISLLSEEPPGATVDVRVEGQADGDWDVFYVESQSIDKGPNQGAWVTLILHGAR